MLNKKDTKQILIESLIQLSRSKPIEKISVSSIVRNCGAGRQTFYNYFHDKYDLINTFYFNNANRICAEYMDTEPWNITIGRVVSFMIENRALFKNALLEEGRTTFFTAFYDHTKNYYINYIRTTYGDKELTEDLLFDIRFNCHGAVHMVKDWLERNMTDPPEILSARIANAMPKAMKKYFRWN